MFRRENATDLTRYLASYDDHGSTAAELLLS